MGAIEFEKNSLHTDNELEFSRAFVRRSLVVVSISQQVGK